MLSCMCSSGVARVISFGGGGKWSKRLMGSCGLPLAIFVAPIYPIYLYTCGTTDNAF